MRIKSKWHRTSKPKTVEETAGALAFITWRIGANAVTQMFNKGFNFSSNAQQLAVIGEFLAFLIQATGHLIIGRLDEQEQGRFINTLALKLVETMNDNLNEEVGEGDYRESFIQTLNERLAQYAEFNFVDGEPGYQCLRHVGTNVDQVMGGSENRWVMEQVAEIEAPEAFKTLKKGVDDLLSQREKALAEAHSSGNESGDENPS